MTFLSSLTWGSNFISILSIRLLRRPSVTDLDKVLRYQTRSTAFPRTKEAPLRLLLVGLQLMASL